MREAVNAILDEVERAVPVAEARTLVAVAGTATTVQAIALGLAFYDPERIHRTRLSRVDAERVASRLARMTTPERAALPVMAPGRADVIVAGAVILVEVMDRFGFDEAVVSETDILDGLVLEMLAARLARDPHAAWCSGTRTPDLRCAERGKYRLSVPGGVTAGRSYGDRQRTDPSRHAGAGREGRSDGLGEPDIAPPPDGEGVDGPESNFDTVRRGFAPDQVAGYLKRVATSVLSLESRLEEIRIELLETRRERDERARGARDLGRTRSDIAASQHVTELVRGFDDQVGGLLRDAEVEAGRVLSDVRTEAGRILATGAGGSRPHRRRGSGGGRTHAGGRADRGSRKRGPSRKDRSTRRGRRTIRA